MEKEANLKKKKNATQQKRLDMQQETLKVFSI